MKINIHPKFHTREIMLTTLRKDWFEIQAGVYEIGQRLHKYIQTYVNSHRKREGGTGNLAKAITFDRHTGAGMVSWGIGNVNILNSQAPYWYVVNYGKMVTGAPYIPAHGNFVPGYFRGGDGRPRAEMTGKGKESFVYEPGGNKGMYPRTPIRPMNYIQATRAKLTRDIRALFIRIKRT